MQGDCVLGQLRIDAMLSSREKRFAWTRPHAGGFSLFGMMMKRRRLRPRPLTKEEREKTPDRRWKPAPWTPWLWIK